MNRREFRAYRTRFERDFSRLLGTYPPLLLDEMALPSYTHRNPLARWLFWERIRVVLSEIEGLRPRTVVDFGCGAGVLFPPLVSRGARIHACDVELTAARDLAERYGWTGITWASEIGDLETIETRSIDLVLALDVLEHVDEPTRARLCRLFSRILADSGRLVISGPTESWFYRLGRRIAGFEHNYHVTNIYDIEAALAPFFRFELRARLVYPVTLFRILTGSARRNA